ncbi:MAG TPA: L,D-transpeptidase family protein [Sphingomicrobium sp.]|nr:L,D-transpeptidase family protein [Sphingomicrobium sp.]
MRTLALALAATAACALSLPGTAAVASVETVEARMTATSAAAIARQDMYEAFGDKQLKPGQYLWRDVPDSAGEPRVVIGLNDQLAYLYRGTTLVAVTTISSGKAPKVTPTGIFNVLEKKPMHRSRKYDNAPMPFMQRIDQYGIALHAGHNPGEPASHGCVRLPAKFAAKLYQVTSVGTPVLIGA